MKYGYLQVSICVAVGIGGPSLTHAAEVQVPKRTEFKPTLSIGRTWRVEVSAMSEEPSLPTERLVDWRPSKISVVYQFAVEAMENIDSEDCYRVRIDPKALNGNPHDGMTIQYWRIYLRQAGLTLKKVERLDGKTGRVEKARLFEAGPVDATDWVEFLPLAFPSFQEGEFDEEHPVKKTKDKRERLRSLDGCVQTEKITRILVDGKEIDSVRMTLYGKRDRIFTLYKRAVAGLTVSGFLERISRTGPQRGVPVVGLGRKSEREGDGLLSATQKVTESGSPCHGDGGAERAPYHRFARADCFPLPPRIPFMLC